MVDPTTQNHKTKMNWHDPRDSFKTEVASRPFLVCVTTPICRVWGSISSVIGPRVTMHNTTLSRDGKSDFLSISLAGWYSDHIFLERIMNEYLLC